MIMKKLLLLLLIIPLISFGQDFRKMSFGQSIEELKETYPTIEFTVEKEMGTFILSHEDIVGGLETTVGYIFLENKFSTGVYDFERLNVFKSADDRYKDFKNISNPLNNKYEMVENNTWHDDYYKDDPNEYGFALRLGNVDFGEEYSKEKIIIIHSLKKSEGLYSHNVFYFSPSMAEFVNAKNESDF